MKNTSILPQFLEKEGIFPNQIAFNVKPVKKAKVLNCTLMYLPELIRFLKTNREFYFLRALVKKLQLDTPDNVGNTILHACQILQFLIFWSTAEHLWLTWCCWGNTSLPRLAAGDGLKGHGGEDNPPPCCHGTSPDPTDPAVPVVAWSPD